MNVKIVEPVFNSGGFSRGRTPVWWGVHKGDKRRGESSFKECSNGVTGANENRQQRGANLDEYC